MEDEVEPPQGQPETSLQAALKTKASLTTIHRCHRPRRLHHLHCPDKLLLDTERSYQRAPASFSPSPLRNCHHRLCLCETAGLPYRRPAFARPKPSQAPILVLSKTIFRLPVRNVPDRPDAETVILQSRRRHGVFSPSLLPRIGYAKRLIGDRIAPRTLLSTTVHCRNRPT